MISCSAFDLQRRELYRAPSVQARSCLTNVWWMPVSVTVGVNNGPICLYNGPLVLVESPFKPGLLRNEIKVSLVSYFSIKNARIPSEVKHACSAFFFFFFGVELFSVGRPCPLLRIKQHLISTAGSSSFYWHNRSLVSFWRPQVWLSVYVYVRLTNIVLTPTLHLEKWMF